MRHVVFLVAAALVVGGTWAGSAQGSIFDFGGFTADALDEDDVPFDIEDLGEAEVLAQFNWYDTDTFEELVDEGTVNLATGTSLVETHPHEHVQDTYVRALYVNATNGGAAVPIGELPDLANSFTLSAHVMRKLSTDVGIIAYAINGFLLWTNSQGHLLLSVYTNGTWKDIEVDDYNHLPFDQWHELRAVYDGSKIYLYIDDRLVATESATGSLGINAHSGWWYLGGVGASGYAFRGYITGVVVSSEAIHPRRGAMPRSRWDFETSDSNTLTSRLPFPFPEDTPPITDDGDIDGPTWDTVSDELFPSRALIFDSDDDQVIASTNATAVSSHGFSVSAWVKLDSSPPSRDQFIVSKERAFNMRVTVDLHLQCRARDPLENWLQAEVPSGWAMDTDVWYHLACTYDGEKLKGYVNGKLAVVTSGGKGYYGATDTTVILGNNTAADSALRGRLTDVAISDGPTEGFRPPTDQYASYDFLDDGQTSLDSLVDGFGEITMTTWGVSWTSDGPPGAREKSLTFANAGSTGGSLSVDGRVLRGVPEFVMSTWLRLDDTPTFAYDIVQRSGQFRLQLKTDRTLVWEVDVSHPSGATTTVVADANSAPLEVGRWHHVAMRWRLDGQRWRADLFVDSVPVASGTAGEDFGRETDDTTSIKIGGAKMGITAPLFEPEWICAYCHLTEQPGEVGNCDPDQTTPYTVNMSYIGPSANEAIVRYWYATDGSQTRCVSNHPIILIQGMGQYPASWYACSVTPSGTLTSNPFHSLGASGTYCDGDRSYTDSTPQWCPDVVSQLVRRGAEVITVDLGWAQQDINESSSYIGWDKDWLLTEGTSGTATTPGNGSPFNFVAYTERAKNTKGGESTSHAFGRNSHPLDNAYVIGLLAEYFYRDGPDGFADQYDELFVPERKVVLVGHSAGGVIANWATVGRSWGERANIPNDPYDGQWMGIDAWPYVERVITLGSPHLGSRIIDFGLAVNQATWALDSTGLEAVFDDLGTKGKQSTKLKTALWHTFKAWERTNNVYPVVHALAPALWDPEGATTYRSLIDDRINDLSTTEDIPTHYQIAGIYNAKKEEDGSVCVRTPTDEVRRNQYLATELGIRGYAYRIVETSVPFSFDFRRAAPYGNADERTCFDFNTGTGISEDCREEPNQVRECSGNLNIGIGWRLLTQGGGDIKLPKIPDDKYRGPYAMGGFKGRRFKLTLLRGGIWAGVGDPGEYGFGDGEALADGAVTVEEARGLHEGYAVKLRSPSINAACDLTIEKGVPFNHHQLRAYRMFQDGYVCDPEHPNPEQCVPLRFNDFLFR
jgi:hypothetical protein